MGANTERTPTGRQQLLAVALRALTAALLWWAVIAFWFSWLTVLALVFAVFATAMTTLLIWTRRRTSRETPAR